jgi:hypothetical protein|nr:MAG TPA: hypothetical protein [Caudoviricetes sp.]
MAIKKTDLQSLNYLALQALNEKQNEPEFKARYEEWKKKKAPQSQRTAPSDRPKLSL